MENLKNAVASALAILNPHGRMLGEEGGGKSMSSALCQDQPRPPAHPVGASPVEIADECKATRTANVSALKHPGQPMKQ